MKWKKTRKSKSTWRARIKISSRWTRKMRMKMMARDLQRKETMGI
jgi:hypothetical protein